MANYGLRFYGTYILRESGVTVTLQVWKRNYNSNTFYLGGLQGLSLEIGGDNEPIYAPVVKTTLRFTLADAFDVGNPFTHSGITDTCIDAAGGVLTKHGQWEEFYTPDPTLYKVFLKIEDAVIWKGFVTPDSWEESMVYHGSITVVARDMLGTLADLPFELANNAKYATVQELIEQAVEFSQGEMELSFNTSRIPVNTETGGSLLNAHISARAFEGQTWWDALTKTLEALGLILRYNGHNMWSVSALRFLPLEIGAASTIHDTEFINLSGLRTLDPPVRDISGTFTVEDQDNDLTPPNPDLLEEVGDIIILDGTPRQDLELMSYALSAPSGSWAVPASGDSILYKITLPPDESLYQAGFTDFAPLYFIANRVPYSGHEWANVPMVVNAVTAPVKLKVRQDGLILTQDGSRMYAVIPGAEGVAIDKVTLYIRAHVGNTTYYLTSDGEWNDSSVVCFLEFNHGTEASINIPVLENAVVDSFDVSVFDVDVDGSHKWTGFGPGYADRTGFIVPLAFSLAYPDGLTIPREYNVVTKYNDSYNVQITREPALGCIDANLTGDFLKNVLVDANKVPLPDEWNWAGQNDGLPLEVLVQMQIMQYYPEALSIFTGTMHDKFQLPIPGAAYSYYQRNCVLLRGTFNFSSNFIHDVALREYRTWEQIWGSVTPRWSRDTKGTTGPGSSGGSGGSSGSSASGQTYANAQAIDELRTRVIELESFWAKDANNNIYAKNQAGVYSYSFITAGGLGTPGGGGGTTDVTLTVNSGVATLVVSGTSVSFYSKAYLDSHLGAAAAKGVGSVALGDYDLVTGDAVKRAINDAISGIGAAGWGASDGVQYADLWVSSQASTKRLSLATHNHDNRYYTQTQVNNLIGAIVPGDPNVQSDWAETNPNADSFIRNKPDVSALDDRVLAIEDWFEIVNGALHIKNGRGLYGDSFITAGGVGSAGGGTSFSYIHTLYDVHQDGIRVLRDDNSAAQTNDVLVLRGSGLWGAVPQASLQPDLSAYVTTSALNTRLGGYVPKVPSATAGNVAVFASGGGLADSGIHNSALAMLPSNNQFTGNNTFTQEVVAAGYKIGSQQVLTAYTEQGGGYSPLLVGYGSCADRAVQYYAKTAHTFSVYKSGQQDPTWNPVLSLQETAIYSYRNLEPGANGTLNIGASAMSWNNMHVKRWFPKPGDTSIYVEYDSSADAFYFHGNIVASGFITALQSNPNA